MDRPFFAVFTVKNVQHAEISVRKCKNWPCFYRHVFAMMRRACLQSEQVVWRQGEAQSRSKVTAQEMSEMGAL